MRMFRIPPASVPIELGLAARKTGLVVVWEGGERSPITAVALRQGCRCSSCTAARAHGRAVAAAADVVIAAVSPVGGYGVNIAFSDGHSQGIFPWALLRELAAAEAQAEINPGPAQTGGPAARS
jgi:prepilin-type processing-associated H-X9-DG protein